MLGEPLSNRGFSPPKWPTDIFVSIDKAVFMMVIPRYGKNRRKGFDEALEVLIAKGDGEKYPESMIYENHYKWHKDFDIQFGYKNGEQTSDTMRIECNPNKCDLTKLGEVFGIMSPNSFPYIYFTRLDFAVDYFSVLDARFFTDKKKSQSHSYTRTGRGIESIYFGSSQSDVQIRVYNKLTERLKFEINPERRKNKEDPLTPVDFDSPWWRVEAQIRQDLHASQDFTKNPFKSLDIYSSLPHSGEWKLQAFAALAERDGVESALSIIPSRTRQRYRKLLESYKDRKIYHPSQAFEEYGNKCFKKLCGELEIIFNEGQLLHSHIGSPGTLYAY